MPLVKCDFNLRFKRMSTRSKTGWLGDSLEKKLAVLNTVIFVIYYACLVSYNTYVDQGMFHVYLICMQGRHAVQDVTKSLPALVLCSPVIIYALTTIIMDTKCLLFIRNHRKSNMNKKGHNVDTIPLRATMISIAVLVPATISCPILGILYYVSDDLQVKFYITYGICNFVAICRNPIIALCTFRANENNKRISAEDERERKRLQAIQLAVDARKKQKSKRASDSLGAEFSLNPSQDTQDNSRVIFKSYLIFSAFLTFNCYSSTANCQRHLNRTRKIISLVSLKLKSV